jgi:hypothetical protein
MVTTGSQLHVAAQWQPVFRQIGLDADAIFSHPDIKSWRTLNDRENCTLDATLANGERLRLHIKRYSGTRAADDEVNGHRALCANQIPTFDLIGYGRVVDGRSFVISVDLAGYQPADKVIATAGDFDRLLMPIADLAAKLHGASLHHRDLYLCHFFVKVADNDIDVRLIDTARVKPLPGPLTRQRWIIKDLAQFWYSTLAPPITDAQRDAWLARYCSSRQIPVTRRLRNAILRKVDWIRRHDRRLVKDQPNRNISIPGS